MYSNTLIDIIARYSPIEIPFLLLLFAEAKKISLNFVPKWLCYTAITADIWALTVFARKMNPYPRFDETKIFVTLIVFLLMHLFFYRLILEKWTLDTNIELVDKQQRQIEFKHIAGITAGLLSIGTHLFLL
jgi:hypothetical protein